VSDPTNPAGPPAEITHLIRQRTEARVRRDWATADALKAEIEAAGWKVTDHRGRTSVSRAAPPTVELDGEIRYGAASAVPSRLDESSDAPWTVIVLASESPDLVSRLLGGLRAHAPAGTQVVIVANDPSEAQSAALQPGAPDRAAIAGREVEVLRTATRLGYAAALNIALRRTAGELVLVADGTARPTGDAFGPLADTLAPPEVAVAGAFGVASAEPGRLRPSALEPSEANDVAAILAGWIAFRRVDYVALGPLDERFVTSAWLDVWWSLRLRAGADPDWTDADPDAESAGPDGGEDQAAGPELSREVRAEGRAGEAPNSEPAAPRRAIRVALPLDRDPVTWPPDRSRLGRRNMYRILDRWGWRDDLV
jgi:hypothetical protein